MNKPNHRCFYKEVNRHVNKESGKFSINHECEMCKKLIFGDGYLEKGEKLEPVGAYDFFEPTEEEKLKTRKKSVAFRNKIRAKHGLTPLGDDGFPVDTTPEERKRNFKKLMEAIGKGEDRA